MTRSVYIASPEGLTGKSAIAIGLLDTLTREVGSVGVFRPLTTRSGIDMLGDMLVNQPGIKQDYDDAIGVTYEQARENPDEAMHTIVERFGRLAERFDVVLVLGSDYTDISTGTELTVNARIAANLGSAGGAGRARPRPHARRGAGRRRGRHRRAPGRTTPTRWR